MKCTQCNLEQSQSSFYMLKTGLMSICKACQKERVKQSRIRTRTSRVDADLVSLYHRLDDDQRTTMASLRTSRKMLGLPDLTVGEMAELLGVNT